MVEITNRNDFEVWLREQPHEVAAVLALRVALRVLPLTVAEFRHGGKSEALIAGGLIFAAFRANAAALFVRYESNLAISAYPARTVASSAIEFMSPSAQEACYAAIHAAVVAASPFYPLTESPAELTAELTEMAARSATSIAADPKSAMEVIWKTVNVDIYSLERSAFEKKLLASPLWPNGIPGWARAAWNELKARLHSIAPHWLVWTAWYQAQLAGRPAWGLPRPEAEALMGKAIQWADGEWMAGPDHINPRLEALVRAAGGEIGREKLPLDDPAPEQEPPPASAGWDFFVSYSQPDEAMAREIVTLLHEAGHSTFVQFNDMPPGANFVTEMQKGLAGSGRVIALYSPAYVASAHCQAEWNTAYAADPTGAKRKLLPFLIVPTDLPPLAQQVVFKSLVGLAADARKRAVLAAIAPPVARSLDEAKRAVANVASPLPKLTDKQRIGLTRNDITDTPRTTRDLAKLPRIMKMMLVENILPSLPDNTPPVVRNGLASYARHLDEQGTRLEPQYLSRVCAGVQREYESAGSDLWGAGLEEWFGKFFEDHNLVKTHFPLKDEEIYAETPIDEQAAMGEALTEPTGKVSAAAQELVDDHHAEPEVGKLFDDIAQQGRDYAHFPPDENAGQPGSTRVSVKRRYVVGTLGVFVAFYNFVGSTASILATDTGMRFFKALGEAIEKLSKLLLLS